MTILKNFKQYTPKDQESQDLIAEINALFLISEEGMDWYESQKMFDPDLLKIVFDADTGVIVSVSTDVSGLWPIGRCVADVDYDTSVQVEDLYGKVFDIETGTIVDRIFTEDELKAKMSSKIASLQKEVSDIITPLQYAADLEIITQEEADYLKKLKLYSVNLSRVSTQKGYPLNVELPTLPKK